MLRKARKISRHLRARLRPGAHAPLFWHVGTPNFGDDINPAFFEALSGKRLRFANDRRAPHFLGMGSILKSATEASVVLGAGLLEPAAGKMPGTVVALRGHLSRRALAIADTIPLGDPMVLVDRLIRPERGHDIGFVPHARALPRLRKQVPAGMHLIDVSRDPWLVLRDIGRCRVILSQSLHGLIAADAFGIPNIWLAPSLEMAGGAFKFHDYFSTLDEGKTAVEITSRLLREPPLHLATVSRYAGNKAEYHAILRAAVREGTAG